VTQVDLAARTGLTDDAINVVVAHLLRSKRLVRVSDTPLILLAIESLKGLQDRVVDNLKNYHKQESLGLGIPREQIREKIFSKSPPEVFRFVITGLINSGQVKADKDLLSIASHSVALTADDQAAKDKLESVFKAAGLQPLAMAETISKLGIESKRAQKLYNLLSTEGRLTKIGDLIFHREVIDQLKNQIKKEKAKDPKLDVGRFKDLTGVSRKYAIPLLEFLDRERITRRVGNDREIL